MKKSIKSIIFLIGMATVFSAHAVSISVSYNTTFQSGEFTVMNDSASDVFAIFVADNGAIQADKTGDALESWAPRVFTRSQWETGTVYFPDFDSPLWTAPDTTLLSWDNIFGAEYDRGFGYWTDGFGEVEQSPIAAGTTQDGFLFYSDTNLPISSWMVYGADSIIATNNTVVPVPAAAWLFGSALLGLAGIGRKRR